MPISLYFPDDDIMRNRYAVAMGSKAASLTSRELGDKRSSKSGKRVTASHSSRNENEHESLSTP